MKRTVPINRVPNVRRSQHQEGQALIEYSLILVLAFIGLIAILTIMAPAVGNVFSNTVYNLLGQTTEPQEPMDPTQFWDVVTAVASYTPESPDLQTNTPIPNTPLPTATDTPGLPTETLTPSITFTPTDVFTSTPTFTPGPSPTPSDTDYGYPFADDGSNPDTFQDEFADEFWNNGPWTAEYWHIDWTNSSGSGCNWGSFFNASTGNITNPPAATISVPRIKFPEPSNPINYWQTLYDKGHPDLNGADFCARYSTSIPLEATTYTINYQKDDGVRIYVSPNGSSWTRIVDQWSYSSALDLQAGTYNYTPPSAGTYYFRVVFRDTGSAGRLTVSMNKQDENTSPACNWELDNSQGNTAPPSWHESPQGTYFRNQECILRLRGTIDLTGAVEPFLEFYDRYNINSFDEAVVGIAVEGTDNWKEATVHRGPETNWTFTRQQFDLARFVDDAGTSTNFTDQRIELRFIFRTDSAGEAEGWWIDDISVREIPENVYYLGFQDPVDVADYWVASADNTWGLSNYPARNGNAWHDSPGYNYPNNSNTNIRLNGRLDLSGASPITVENPEIVFWQYVDIAASDRVYVEISTDKANWSALATQSVLGARPAGPIVQGAYTSTSWTQVRATIPLSYIGQARVYVRFRFETDGGSNDDGWMIDDIEFRNKPTATLPTGACDTFDGGTSNWVLNGQWGTTSSVVYDGAFALADTPSGNYSSNTNYSAEMVTYLDVNGMTRPAVTFYHQWDIKESDDSNDELVVEVSVDDGNTWDKVFSFLDEDNTVSGQNELDPYPNWGISIPQYDERMDEVMSWQREVIDLTPYIGAVAPGVPGLKFRYRLYADGSVTEDGWYIDTVCFRDQVEPLITLPFADDMEAGTFNWYVGSTWQVTTEKARSGSNAWSDTPSGNLSVDTTSLLELRPTINLTGAIDPALYFWTTYNHSGSNQNWDVEIAQVDASGSLLSDWTLVSGTLVSAARNNGWHRIEVDLRPYIGQNIRIRWQSSSLNNGSGNDGLYLDDVQVISRTEESTYTTPYNEDIEALNPGEYVYEHQWAVATENRSFGSGASLGPGQWSATWYNGVSNACNNNMTLTNLWGTTTEDEVNFPNNPHGNNNTWGVVLIRTLFIPAATEYIFTGRVDDGIRVWVYPTGTLYDPNNPTFEWRWNCSGDFDYTSPPIPFPAGNVDVRIEYFENSGGEEVSLNFAGESQVFTDSPSGNYGNRVESVVELEGLVTVPASSNYTLYWDQRYYLNSNHRILVEVSTDGGFTWTSIYSRSGWVNQQNWETRTADLTSYAGNAVAVRFRLDALSSDGGLDGWWIDNIRIIE